MSKMETTVYVLQLETNKFYVGSTNDVKRRFQEHKQGMGSEWTKKYKPISIIRIYDQASSFDEDKYVKIYMSKYGIDNVRGGSYSNITLTISQIELLKREIYGSTGACFRCGRKGHFIKDCYASTDINGNFLTNIGGAKSRVYFNLILDIHHKYQKSFEIGFFVCSYKTVEFSQMFKRLFKR